MTDFEDVCYDYQGVRIPMCWDAVLYGDDACTCEGSPNAIAMDRRWRAWLRLEGIRERKRDMAARADGLRALPGSRPFKREGPFVRVPLRAIHERTSG